MRVFGRLALAILFCGASSVAAEPLTFGRVDGDVREATAGLAAMSAYVAERVEGLEAARPMIFDSLPELIEAMRAGRVDLASETIYGALVLERDAGGRLLMREHRKGERRYRSVILVRDDGPMTFEDLVGARVAFEDPGSTSGFFLPVSALLASGAELRLIPNMRAEAPRGKVGYAFLDDEQSIPLAIAAGIAQAGGFSEGDWLETRADFPEVAGRLQVMMRSPYVIRSLLIAGPSLPERFVPQIMAVFAALSETESGRAIAKIYNSADAYDSLEGAEAAADLAAGRALFANFGRRLPQ